MRTNFAFTGRPAGPGYYERKRKDRRARQTQDRENFFNNVAASCAAFMCANLMLFGGWQSQNSACETAQKAQDDLFNKSNQVERMTQRFEQEETEYSEKNWQDSQPNYAWSTPDIPSSNWN